MSRMKFYSGNKIKYPQDDSSGKITLQRKCAIKVPNKPFGNIKDLLQNNYYIIRNILGSVIITSADNLKLPRIHHGKERGSPEKATLATDIVI